MAPKKAPKRKKSVPTGLDGGAISAYYATNLPRFEALKDEIVFVLNSILKKTSIKLHGIESRVKSVDLILEKCGRLGSDTPFTDFDDIVAARVICLFKEDIEAIGKQISKAFQVIKVDDKRISDNAPLGYLSVHYICKIPHTYKGPRYDDTSDIVFEIQVRTLCMHCWAAVSHHLDYKGDWDVPKELKMALSALSGLFYVADNEFQQFYAARLASKHSAETASKPTKAPDAEINLDTLTAYLKSTLPEREWASPTAVSDLILEMKRAGYGLISEVDRDLKRSMDAFNAYEPIHPPGSGNLYNAVGVVRAALTINSEKYQKARNDGVSDHTEWSDFRHLVKD